MWFVIFGGILIFAGIYLIIKCLIHRKKGIHIDAMLIGFQEERGTRYPLFRFTYEGEEINITGGVPAEPAKFKYQEGDTVKVVFDPSNRKFVDVAGSATEILYGLASIVLGAILAFAQLKKMGVM